MYALGVVFLLWAIGVAYVSLALLFITEAICADISATIAMVVALLTTGVVYLGVAAFAAAHHRNGCDIRVLQGRAFNWSLTGNLLSYLLFVAQLAANVANVEYTMRNLTPNNVSRTVVISILAACAIWFHLYDLEYRRINSAKLLIAGESMS